MGTREVRADRQLLHLGVGAFARSLPLWCTARLDDHEGQWGVIGFAGRPGTLRHSLIGEEARFALITRGPERDVIESVDILSAIHPNEAVDEWSASVSDPRTKVVTVTITEKGHHLRPDESLNLDDESVQFDIAALRSDAQHAVVRTALGKLVQAALVRGDAGTLAVVSCDNLVRNGELLARAVLELSDTIGPHARDAVGILDFVASMVDRVTPQVTAADRALAASQLSRDSKTVVVTEPFFEWVIAEAPRSDLPEWERVGVDRSEDLAPHQQRKLLLLNGAHSLLAYRGLELGHATIAEAMTDSALVDEVGDWWQVARGFVPLPVDVIDSYLSTVTTRFRNPRMQHRLHQIAEDGSVKLRERLRPLVPAAGSNLPIPLVRVLAAWVHGWQSGALSVDPGAQRLKAARGAADREATRICLREIDRQLAMDDDVVDAVTDQMRLPARST